MPFSGVMTATVLLCFTMTLFMGLYAKLPFAVAPGMGINAFFAFTIILGSQVPWQTALGITFWAGILFLLISVTPLRVAIAHAIPQSLRMATAAGIGIFLTFIGLKNAGFITSDPATFVKLGKLDAKSLMSILGMIVMIVLLRKRSAFAFLAGIAVVTVCGLIFGYVQVPETMVSTPDFSSVLFKLDIMGALQLAFLPAMISILFTDLFDSISTFVGVSHASGMVDKDGEPLRLREGLIVDSFATFGAGLLGTSSGTAYIESASGIEAGGRTGLTSVFTALCFLPCLFLAPIAGMVPAYATAPVLILVGAMMFKSIGALRFERLEDLIPAFLTIVLIPLTFSITQGILWGFISHTVLYAITGKARQVKPMMYGLAVLSVILIAFEHGNWK